MNKINLLELCLSPDLGGLELYMYNCAHALKDEMNVISVVNSKGKLKEYFASKDDRFELLEKRSNIFMFFAAKKLSRIIDENSIDLLHLHWTKDIPIAVLAEKLSNKDVKLIQTRNMTMTRFKDDFYHKFLYKNIDLMLPVTHQVAAQLEKFIPQQIRPKIEVLYMGSDSVVPLSEDEKLSLKRKYGMLDTFNIAMVGRIEEAKGQYLLIEAIDKLKTLNVKAYFIGHAMHESYLEELKNLVKSKNLEKRIEFVGFMKKPTDFMQVCDAMVLATPCETFGLVLIEAMHSSCAAIATNQCGPLEIIEDKKDGLLFENKDSDSLAKQIELLCSDENLKNEIIQNAYKKANEKFSSKIQFQELSRILKALA